MTHRDRMRRWTLTHARPCPGGCGGVVLSRYAHYCRSCSKRLVRAAGRVHCRLSTDDKRAMAHAAAVALLQQHEPVLLQVFGGWVDPPTPKETYPEPDSYVLPDLITELVFKPAPVTPLTTMQQCSCLCRRECEENVRNDLPVLCERTTAVLMGEDRELIRL